ncbi:MAG: bis(5'-nucleosyl)-tetraphosphatase (symmetrical) YqeK [Lachnospiraceae bacterium]|nr:bis(5'-nucleosyl)-tetraphosphatase (symmetrical) YqeK [Lachnospiraceae bacterium]
MDLKKLRKKMKKVMDDERYEHTLSVAYTAANLAAVHGADVEKALRAGMLHDCAKCLTDSEKLTLCEKFHINISAVERRNPSLLHAELGAKLAKDLYEETDKDVLNAISSHTTGRPGMSLLEKIIFVADYIEPGRNKAPNLKQIRKLAYDDIDLAVIQILQDTMDYLVKTKSDIHPGTQRTLEYYLKQSKEGRGHGSKRNRETGN